MLGITLCYPFTIDGLAAGYEDGGFAAIMICDSQDRVIAPRLREVGDKV
jgi:hypothetical protein